MYITLSEQRQGQTMVATRLEEVTSQASHRNIIGMVKVSRNVTNYGKPKTVQH